MELESFFKDDQQDEETLIALQTLLAKGVADLQTGVDVTRISRLMNSLNYETVVLNHKRVIVLKDKYSGTTPLQPWTEDTTNAAKIIIMDLCSGNFHDYENPVVQQLVENGWIRTAGNRRYELTERALVQFSDLILCHEGTKYKKCQVCGYLCKNAEFHDECKNILDQS